MPKPGSRIVVVGGANTDLAGHSSAPLVAFDSNPGRISRSAGGVGRNIAENLARLGADVALVTAFGDDLASRELAEGCRALGIDVGLSVTATGVPGSVYLAVLDDTGDMAVAINDMRALDALTPEVVMRHVDALDAASLVVLDANLPANTVAAIATRVTAPLMLDPVSVAKASRTRAVLPRLAAVKCNVAEAAELLGVPNPAVPGANATGLADALHAAGSSVAIVTDGPHGVAYAGAGCRGHLPAPDVRVANATGAGDAFSAGVAYAIAAGHAAQQAAALGSALASFALSSESTVSPDIYPGLVRTIERGWDA